MNIKELDSLLAKIDDEAVLDQIKKLVVRNKRAKSLGTFTDLQKLAIAGVCEHKKSANYIAEHLASGVSTAKDNQSISVAMQTVIKKVNVYCKFNGIDKQFESVVDVKRRNTEFFQLCREIDPSIKPTRLKVTITLEEIEQ